MEAWTIQHIPPEPRFPALLPNGSQMPGEIFPTFPPGFTQKGFPGKGSPHSNPPEHLGMSLEEPQPCQSHPDPSLIPRGFSWWIPGISKGMQPDVRSRFSLSKAPLPLFPDKRDQGSWNRRLEPPRFPHASGKPEIFSIVTPNNKIWRI